MTGAPQQSDGGSQTHAEAKWDTKPDGSLTRMLKPVRAGIPNVAADVNPLISPAKEKFEPTHVGCYGEMNQYQCKSNPRRRRAAWRAVPDCRRSK